MLIMFYHVLSCFPIKLYDFQGVRHGRSSGTKDQKSTIKLPDIAVVMMYRASKPWIVRISLRSLRTLASLRVPQKTMALRGS